MYGFILNMWVMDRCTEENLQVFVSKGYITQQESDMIQATPRTGM